MQIVHVAYTQCQPVLPWTPAEVVPPHACRSTDFPAGGPVSHQGISYRLSLRVNCPRSHYSCYNFQGCSYKVVFLLTVIAKSIEKRKDICASILSQSCLPVSIFCLQSCLMSALSLSLPCLHRPFSVCHLKVCVSVFPVS